MYSIVPYLTFEGNCREAMEYYKSIFGGDLFIQDASQSDHSSVFKNSNSVIHSVLKSGSVQIIASDSWKDQAVVFGNSVYMSVICSSIDEIEELFSKLSIDARFVKMPLQDTFWNARFGILTDKFGINWMFNFDYPKKI